MPTYQYACTNSEGKHEFEVVQSFSDPALTECVECGAPARKVYGSVGVVFKGSGFYRTDSRNGSSSKTAANDSSSAAGSSGDSSSSGSSSSDSSGSSSSTAAPAATSSASGGTGSGGGPKAAG